MDSVFYVDDQAKRIIYTCTLNIVDDNLSDTHLYKQTVGPAWFTTADWVSNNIINIDASSIAEGDYSVSASVKDTASTKYCSLIVLSFPLSGLVPK